MSEDRNNELNEQELWDLIQTPAEAEAPKAEKKTAPKADKPKAVVNEKRKKALVGYLAGLFGIAFIVVLISLVLGGNGSNDDAGQVDAAQIQQLHDRISDLESEKAALENVVAALEAENQELKDDNLDLQVMMDGLNLMIDEMSTSLEYVEGNNLYADENSEKLAKTMKAYQLLVTAQNAFIDYDKAVLDATMSELTEYLDLLTQDALNAYYMVIEYMEQPYLGQE